MYNPYVILHIQDQQRNQIKFFQSITNFNQMKGVIMDHQFITQLIEDINITLGLHQDGINEDFHSNCQCNSPEVSGKCYYCQMKENIHNLSESMKTLNEYTPNTSNLVQLIDAEAFRVALEENISIESITCYPVFNDRSAELNYPDSEPDSFAIEATTSRYAMNGTGYHVGYETVTYKWIAIEKTQLGILGLPYLLSRWVIDPDQYEIITKNLPINEDPDPNLNHDDDCEFKGQDFDQCDCIEFWDGYYQPEDDFFYSEMNAIIFQLKYPDAEFDSEMREWTLGAVSFNLNEYETIDEYADSVNQDNGMPFTC